MHRLPRYDLLNCIILVQFIAKYKYSTLTYLLCHLLLSIHYSKYKK